MELKATPKSKDFEESSQLMRTSSLRLQVKFDLKFFREEVDTKDLNQWFKQIEVNV